MPRPTWIIRDQALDEPSPRRTPQEQGEILVEVIALGEAINAAKGDPLRPGPLQMPLLSTLRTRRD